MITNQCNLLEKQEHLLRNTMATSMIQFQEQMLKY